MRSSNYLTTLKRLVLYISRLGLIQGIRNFRLLRMKTSPGPVLVSLYSSGPQLLLRRSKEDRQAFEDVFVKQIYDFHLDIHPKNIIDAGAHIGCASVYFANRYPGAKIYAIEPDQSNIELLKRNASNYPQIEILQAGIWHRKSRVRIQDLAAKRTSFTLVESTDPSAETLDAYTVMDILEMKKLDYVDILKMDIEGSEKEIFSQKSDWLDRVGLLVIELHDRHIPGCSDAFKSAMAQHNFRCRFRGQMAYATRD